MKKVIRAATLAAAAATISGYAFAASPFEGVYEVTDTAGKPYQITLSADGTAKGTQEEGMTGSWTIEGENTAVINWNTGWTTKLRKDGDNYLKSATKAGSEAEAAEESAAQKVK